LPTSFDAKLLEQDVLGWDFLKMMVEKQLNGKILMRGNKMEFAYP
jgi:hypothetical protein